MIHIIRPTATTLALVEYDYAREAETDYMGEVITWAIPDVAFWAWLDHRPSYSQYLDQMEAENPARLIRARAFVGRLRSEKGCITAKGFTRDSLAANRPANKFLLTD